MGAIENILEGVRVLCVDDNSDILGLLSHVLDRWGMQVTTCASAEEAIAMLRDQRFDVLISDLSMPPGLDGFDLVHALRGMELQDPTRNVTPAIALSGDAMRPSRKRRFADFQVYMQKPFDNARLSYILERLSEADGEAVKFGSLGIWEADQATEIAANATIVAAGATESAADATIAAVDATSAALEATSAAVDATVAAVQATAAAAKGKRAASLVEEKASHAGARAPQNSSKDLL